MGKLSKWRMVVLMICILLAGGFFLRCNAQQFTENIILPVAMKSSNVSDFQVSVDHTMHVFGLATDVSSTGWSESGVSAPYYLKLDASRNSLIHVIPDTGYYYSDVTDLERDLFRIHGAVTDSGVVVFYSKQHLSESDVPPAYYSPPSVTAVWMRNESSSAKTIFKDSTGANPQTLRDSNGNIHFVWERHRKLPGLAYDTYADRYKSAIYYTRENAGGQLLGLQFVDSGYSPRFRISDKNDLDLIWFSADSSRSKTFALKYAHVSNGVFQHPLPADTIFSGEQSWLYSFEVSQNGSLVHIGWRRPGSRGVGTFFSLRIVDGVKELDSLVVSDSTGFRYFHYLFNSRTGTVKAVWALTNSSEVHYVSTTEGGLFEHVQTLHDTNAVYPVEYFINPSTDHLIMVSETFDRSYQLYDLESYPESEILATSTDRWWVGELAIGADQDVYVIPRISDTYRLVTRFTQRFLPVGENRQVANEFQLSQNYPNPFNPSTTIQYSLPFESSVKLTLFNILGQNVRILKNGIDSAGRHAVQMDGSGLPSGVYFYRLEATSISSHAQSVTETRRMLLIK